MLLTVSCFPDTEKSVQRSQISFSQKVFQLDLLSNLLFVPALTGLFLAFSWAGTKYSWKSGQVIGTLVTFAILLTAFAFNQHRQGDAAALPVRVVKRRTVVAGVFFIACLNSTGTVIEYYLPTYYQVVRGYKPAESGYLLLPIIIAAILGSLVHGVGTSIFGYYAPFMLFASIIQPISAGLITTFGLHTALPELIAYSTLSGLAYGVGFSGPQNAVQTMLSAEDVPLGLSIMLFGQSFGPAIAVAVAQVLFTNRLASNLGGLTPGFNSPVIEESGLIEIMLEVPQSKVSAALVEVNRSITQTLYLAVGLGCATILGSLSIEWKSVKSKRA